MPFAFAEAVTRGLLGEIVQAFQVAVEASYITFPVRHRTQAEDKRRVARCEAYFRMLVEQTPYRWSTERALSHLREALEHELRTGERWKPPEKSTLFAPDRLILQGAGASRDDLPAIHHDIKRELVRKGRAR